MKKNNTNLVLLTVIFVVSLVISNVVASRLITTGITIWGIPISAPGAVIAYAFTFLCTDVIGEIWGRQKAQSVVKYGLFGQIFASIMFFLTGFLPTQDIEVDKAFHLLLGQNIMFVIGSLCAYLTSQTWDVYIFHKTRNYFIAKYEYHGQYRWIWNNLSTCTSQILDTIIFILISFGVGFGWLFDPNMHKTLIGIMIGQYVIKFCLALLDTPIFYILTHRQVSLYENKTKD